MEKNIELGNIYKSLVNIPGSFFRQQTRGEGEESPAVIRMNFLFPFALSNGRKCKNWTAIQIAIRNDLAIFPFCMEISMVFLLKFSAKRKILL